MALGSGIEDQQVEYQMKDYTNLEKQVDAAAEVIWDMASRVWEFAELGFEEEKSSAYESGVLEKNGFTISDRGIGGIETSWIATWGSGSPVLGILSSSTHCRVWAMTRWQRKRQRRAATPMGTAAGIT